MFLASVSLHGWLLCLKLWRVCNVIFTNIHICTHTHTSRNIRLLISDRSVHLLTEQLAWVLHAQCDVVRARCALCIQWGLYHRKGTLELWNLDLTQGGFLICPSALLKRAKGTFALDVKTHIWGKMGQGLYTNILGCNQWSPGEITGVSL